MRRTILGAVLAVSAVTLAGLNGAAPAQAATPQAKPLHAANASLQWETFGKAGVYARGSLWDSGGRTYIKGYVKDTDGKNKKNASLYIVFYGKNPFKSRTEHVVANGGGGSVKSFSFNSQFGYRVNVRECVDNSWSLESCGPWYPLLVNFG